MKLFQNPMAEEHTITNVYCAYFDNEQFFYPPNELTTAYIKSDKGRYISTGWHICPNLLWSHLVTPKQWAELIINYEAYHVDGISCTLYNPVPITSNIAIQRTNLFAAFNNCTYLMGYDDDLYETSNFQWNEQQPGDRLNLAFKEGIFYTGCKTLGKAIDGNNSDLTWKRYKWPIYGWRRPDHRTPSSEVWSQGEAGGDAILHTFYSGESDTQPLPTGIFWDPFNRPDHIKELRAGKNSMSFAWSCHPSDAGRWFNFDQLASWIPWTAAGPYCGGKRPGTFQYAYTEDPDQLSSYGLAQKNENNSSTAGSTGVRPWQDYSIPNFAFIPVVPNTWWWKEMEASIIESQTGSTGEMRYKPDKYYAGTEYEMHKYPPTQWFCKGLPLLDGANQLIRTSTQVAVKMSLHLQCKKRRSAIYSATWGPFAGRQLYHADYTSRIYQPAMIRYRTAGARRTWQNVNRWGNTSASDNYQLQAHPREDPYLVPITTYASLTPLPPSVPVPTTTSAGSQAKAATTVTYSKENDSVTFSIPKLFPRKHRDKTERAASPGRMLDEDMMEDIQQGP